MKDAELRHGRPRGIFSQMDEDFVLLRHFDTFGVRMGKFLDIGAYDGEYLSNTRALAMRGWEGVSVEAAPQCYAELVKLYPEKQKAVQCVHAAITVEQAGEIELFESTDPVSTTETKNRDRFAYLTPFNAVKVPAMPIADLLKAYPGPYDLISIDTEGTSVDLAFLVPLEVVTDAGVVCVEQDTLLDDMIEGMEKNGFKLLHENGLNALFVKATLS